MEVRIEKKKKKMPKISLRTLLIGVAICLLGGIFVWNAGRKMILAANYQMEKKYTFNVVEVVPNKNQAVLGLYIKGKENVAVEAMTKLANDPNHKGEDWEKFFCWADGSLPCKKEEREPLTIVKENNGNKVINNELFKLCMLGIGKYDENKSSYENLINNKSVLEQFDKKYDIVYRVMTPEELNNADLEQIDYLQIGGLPTIKWYWELHEAIPNKDGQPGTWVYGYNSSSDISFPTALKIYRRAIATENSLSVSIASSALLPGEGANETKEDLNIYALYQMLNFTDNPADFQRVFKDGDKKGDLVSKKSYIDVDTTAPNDGNIKSGYGRIWLDGNDRGWFWSDENLKGLPWGDVGTAVSSGGESLRGKVLEGFTDYIPKARENILIYYQSDWKYPKYLSATESLRNIKKVIHFYDSELSGEVIPEERDGHIKVLEIEPCNSYWLSDAKNVNQLAAAIGGGTAADDISVTFVTPNRLNGMAVDLVAEYDLIMVGDNVGVFSSESTQYKRSYHQIGPIEDAVVPQAKVNGLLSSDYSTAGDFNKLVDPFKTQLDYGSIEKAKLTLSDSQYWNPGIRKQWETISGGKGTPPHFLKNVELFLELSPLQKDKSLAVSKARFSGNDLNRYKQKQLAEFVNSGQPVIVADNMHPTLMEKAGKQIGEFNVADIFNEEWPLQTEMDARLYFALYGVADETIYYGLGGKGKGIDGPNGNLIPLSTVVKTNPSSPDYRPTVALAKDLKASVWISDIGNGASNVPPTIAMKWGLNQGQQLDTLAKSNIVSFNYSITLPRGDNPKNCVMKVIFDRNGDGVFDEEGEGKTQGKDGKKGTQNNAVKESIRNDKVYVYDFSKETENWTYISDSNLISGTYTTPEPIEAIEEFCEFQVVVTTKDKTNKLRGSWTGYMRPDLAKKKVRVLQITPYPQDMGTVPLSENEQFTGLVNSLTDLEYSFDFSENGFKTITEGDFAEKCRDGEITEDGLKQDYDLIIAGTDFNSQGTNSGMKSDIKEVKAAEVLRKYADIYKRPIIFTNDFVSYINSENYFIPQTMQNLPNGNYGLVDAVGGNSPPWNYFATQSLRYTLGMDRFAVTTDKEPIKKRDRGTCRRYNKVDEIQGFTNGMLLEYAYIPPAGLPLKNQLSLVNKKSPYSDAKLSLGTKPRTRSIELLNEGPISHYPFEITESDNLNMKIDISENHPPYYQLDLEREIGEGKIDDVTVWYTLAGNRTMPKGDTSEYFRLTSRDAGNNYYLYSKGKMYYTGFSLKKGSNGEGPGGSVPELEMKLFINTIYAALSGEPAKAEQDVYETVVQAVAPVSLISRAGKVGENNRYVCYYDEDEEYLTFRFRTQKVTAKDAETTAIMLGFKEKDKIIPLESGAYSLVENTDLSKFPVEISPSPPGGSTSDSGLVNDAGNWYEIKFGNEFMPTRVLDGKTLIIAIEDLRGGVEPSTQIKTDAIHTEIQFVMRNLFDLD